MKNAAKESKHPANYFRGISNESKAWPVSHFLPVM
jgi:hypothetical protein